MNQVLPSDNMQFNKELLQPSMAFVGGFGGEISKSSELKKFEFEDLKQTGKNTGKNIEEVDFGLYQRHREAIIKVARDIGKLQAEDYSKERQELAEELAGKVTDRTMGIIRHGIIAPVIMPAVSFSTEVLTKHLMEFSSKGKISGVSGGGSYINEKEEVDEEGYLQKAEQIINQVNEYVYDEFDNICKKLELAKEDIIWASSNKIEASKAIGKWIAENPEKAADVGINIVSLIPAVGSLRILLQSGKLGYNAYKIFTPGEGFKNAELPIIENKKPILEFTKGEEGHYRLSENKKQWFLPSGEVYHKGDVNWDQIRTDGPIEFIGKTNAQARKGGYLRQLPNGEFLCVKRIEREINLNKPSKLANTSKIEVEKVKNTIEPIKFDGKYYSVSGFKIAEKYYNKLWEQGRSAPFLQAREILQNNPQITPDPRMKEGFYKYESVGLEMIYNPNTEEIWHINFVKKNK